MKNRQPRTVATADFWRNFNPSTEPILRSLVDRGFEPTSDVRRADLVISSAFGTKHWSARGCVVLFSGEPEFDDTFAHYSIDWRFRPSSTHLRLPLWAYTLIKSADALPPPRTNSGVHFCNFIYSNPKCGMRNAFFSQLHARRPIHSMGSVMNNHQDARLLKRHEVGDLLSKVDVLTDYRFTIAFENRELPGYTTEKILDAWRAGSVPIFWGDPAITVDFPPDSYLSLYEAGSMHRLVEQVLEVNNDPQRYAQLQAANPLRTGHMQDVVEKYRSQFAEFCDTISTSLHMSPRAPIGRRRGRVARKLSTRLRKIL